jgi:hypothetical protein
LSVVTVDFAQAGAGSLFAAKALEQQRLSELAVDEKSLEE